MNKEVLAGLACVIALGAVIFFHGHKSAAVKPVPVAPVAAPVAVPSPHDPFAETGPVPTPAAQMPVLTPLEDEVAKKCTVANPCHTVKVTGTPQKPVYNKVLKGGRVAGPINCKQVPLVAKSFSPERVLAAAKDYGLTPDQLAQLRVCLN